jgi:hypothetical protein
MIEGDSSQPTDDEIFAALAIFIIRAEEAGYDFAPANRDAAREKVGKIVEVETQTDDLMVLPPSAPGSWGRKAEWSYTGGRDGRSSFRLRLCSRANMRANMSGLLLPVSLKRYRASAACAGAPKTVGESRESLFTAAMLSRSLAEFFSARHQRMQSILPPNAAAEQKSLGLLLHRVASLLQTLLPQLLHQEACESNHMAFSADELLREFLRSSVFEATNAGFNVIVEPCACPPSFHPILIRCRCNCSECEHRCGRRRLPRRCDTPCRDAWCIRDD